MLTPRHVATLRAALLFWQEEMCPSGSEVMHPYMEPPGIEPLSTIETVELREGLNRNVCYAVYDAERRCLDSTELFLDHPAAELAAGGAALATVILPAAVSPED